MARGSCGAKVPPPPRAQYPFFKKRLVIFLAPQGGEKTKNRGKLGVFYT